jgi:hypothetical protein
MRSGDRSPPNNSSGASQVHLSPTGWSGSLTSRGDPSGSSGHCRASSSTAEASGRSARPHAPRSAVNQAVGQARPRSVSRTGLDRGSASSHTRFIERGARPHGNVRPRRAGSCNARIAEISASVRLRGCGVTRNQCPLAVFSNSTNLPCESKRSDQSATRLSSSTCGYHPA